MHEQTPDCRPAESTCPVCGAAGAATGELSAEVARRLLGERLAGQLGIYPLPAGFRLSVVIPVFNERQTLREIVRRVRAEPTAKEIILVDDGSTDGTRELLATMEEETDLVVVYHERNRGKGAALRTGFGRATGDVVLVQDADLEYDPGQYRQLVQPIVEGVADVVYGSRFAFGGPHRVLYFWHYVANRLLTTVSNMFTDLNLTDMETCYKVFRREVIQEIAPTAAREPLRDRGGTDGEGGATTRADLRAGDQLLRPHLRRREKDRPARCLSGAVVHRAVLEVGLGCAGLKCNNTASVTFLGLQAVAAGQERNLRCSAECSRRFLLPGLALAAYSRLSRKQPIA